MNNLAKIEKEIRADIKIGNLLEFGLYDVWSEGQTLTRYLEDELGYTVIPNKKTITISEAEDLLMSLRKKICKIS